MECNDLMNMLDTIILCHSC